MKKLKLRFSRLEIVAFVAGFVLMVFELAGARILAPGIGSSTYVWTSVIGVIIAALSLGYFAGGKVADSRGYMIDIARLALLSGFAIAITMLAYDGVIDWVADTFDDPRLQGVMASLILFAPTSFLLGVISPYLAKLNVRSLHTTGRAIASLSALNSIGGIIGTFTAGFILFGYIGSHETLGLTAVLMVLVSWLAVPRIQWKVRALFATSVLALLLLSVPQGNVVAIDTPTARYSVYNYKDWRVLTTGPGAAQSGISLSKPTELAFWYTKQLADIVERAPNKDEILVLGGGTFTLPQYLAHKYPDSHIDVVEIDPGLVDIARKYFRYSDPQNIHLIFADARTYTNQTDKQYDIVIVDVYSDTYVPFTLLTYEYGQRLDRITRPEGIVGVNFIAGMNNACGTLFAALDAPYRNNFGSASYKIESPHEASSNIVAVYSRDSFDWPNSVAPKSPATEAYKDNYVPAERLQYECFLEKD